jgi:hypothetical protein
MKVGKQVVRIFFREDILERWHLSFSVLQDGTDLYIRLFGVGLFQLAIQARPKPNLIGKHGVALETSLGKDFLAGMHSLLFRRTVPLSIGGNGDGER